VAFRKLRSQLPKAPLPKGAVHSAEIEYAMGNLGYNKVYAWTPEDHKVSATMQEYFANFIKTHNPNGKGLPEWLPVKPKADAHYMYIDVDSKLKTGQAQRQVYAAGCDGDEELMFIENDGGKAFRRLSGSLFCIKMKA
jgi:carboxylesterase type B